MYTGVHQSYVWEISNGELVISHADARIGPLITQPINNRFNNAEQATWFAQGRIDTQLETLAQLAAQAKAK